MASANSFANASVPSMDEYTELAEILLKFLDKIGQSDWIELNGIYRPACCLRAKDVEKFERAGILRIDNRAPVAPDADTLIPDNSKGYPSFSEPRCCACNHFLRLPGGCGVCNNGYPPSDEVPVVPMIWFPPGVFVENLKVDDNLVVVNKEVVGIKSRESYLTLATGERYELGEFLSINPRNYDRVHTFSHTWKFSAQELNFANDKKKDKFPSISNSIQHDKACLNGDACICALGRSNVCEWLRATTRNSP